MFCFQPCILDHMHLRGHPYHRACRKRSNFQYHQPTPQL
jgi:hypothetical protein